jgi:glycerophosphoryl diester phosphodiesterase
MRFWISLILWFVVWGVPSSGQVIVAHRGASFDAPENTLAAFNLAWAQGSDGVEGDFYLTRDEQIVCIHDRGTTRTTGVSKSVEDSTLAELRQLEYGSWKGKKWKGEQIPTFQDVFKSVPEGGLFVIELKSKSKIVPFLASQLKSLDTEKIRLLIISFDKATVAACHEQIPEVRAHWLTSFKKDKKNGRYQPSAEAIAKVVNESGAAGVGMNGNRQVIDELFVKQLKKLGCNEFHVWTIDQLKDAAYFKDLGAFGITTNKPALIGTIRSEGNE